MEFNAALRAQSRSYAFIAGSLICLSSLVVIVLWLSGFITGLDKTREIYYPKFNTSVLFFLCSLCIFITLNEKKKAGVIISIVIALLSLSTLSQYVFHSTYGIDEFFVHDTGSTSAYPGRMSPNATLAFGVAAVVMLLLNYKTSFPLTQLVVKEILSIIIFTIGLAAFIGRLKNVDLAYSFGSESRMSITAGILFMLLGTALISIIWHRHDTKTSRVPIWVPALLCFLVLLLDISTPYGITVGICYIPLVFCGLWFNRPHITFVFAATGTLLSFFGYYLKPPGDFSEAIVITNRIITIGALWMVAGLVFLQKRNESKLRHYTEKLELSNQELDDFAYIASHDLKEPLRGLHNHSIFLLEDYGDKLDNEGKRRLERLSKLCQRMESLVNDLLYFSRLGRGELAITRVDPRMIIDEIKMMMEVTLKEKNASVITNYMPVVICDRTKLTEVFRNLITNGVKYNTNPHPIVEVGWDNAHSAFYVKDNGIGIDKEFHAEIFRIFKRLNPPEENDGGTGVGLTFVKKIIERHRGRIWLESAPGKGSIFYFTLGERV